MNSQLKIGIIGFGNMGSCLGEVLKEAGKEILVYDKDKKKIKNIKGFKVCRDTKELIKKSNIVILAIKPQDMENFLKENKEYLLNYQPLLISIAAGITTSFFEKRIENIKVVRVMPNLAVKVKKSISFMCRGKNASFQDLKITKEIFSLVGKVLTVKENLIDKITALSGSGPGYVYYFMDCVYRAACKLGFKKEEAKKLVLFTFLGATQLAENSYKDFDVLIREVASPKGTTEAGLNIFKKKKLAKIIEESIKSAYKRAKEISKSLN
jgi:pyrroline-5-carboxylate reductase